MAPTLWPTGPAVSCDPGRAASANGRAAQALPSLTALNLAGSRDVCPAAVLRLSALEELSLADCFLRPPPCDLAVHAAAAATAEGDGRELPPGGARLRSLDLSGLGSSGTQAALYILRRLAAAAAANRVGVFGGACLTGLELSRTPLGPAGARVVTAALRHAGCLTDLGLYDVALGPDGAAALGAALGAPQAVASVMRRLRLGRNRAGLVPTWVAGLAGLETLDLSGNGLDRRDAPALAAALTACTRLSALHLSGNELLAESGGGAPGKPSWWEAVGRLSRLEHLELYGNRLGPAGVRTLCVALRPCTRLRRLGLGLTAAGPEGAAAVGPLAAGAPGLASLDLYDCGIGRGGAEVANAVVSALAEGLGRCVRLRRLDLRVNGLGSQHAGVLGARLPAECALLL